ncbi:MULTISPECIES: LysR substrate-binding domain-containing protein [Pseudomonas]|uniref:DNA-binding transcriptional regulator, LysR family n=3 Tax=Gammaproteobacteria TaxID=1236 RepID=A0A653B6F5_ECTOL|nr:MULTISPECIES: LysR substrate-binding domain-containing protein [Pseudomonas]QTS87332.1 LysR family transcriptional regulator [Pseudomonas khazarica]TNF13306.1 MAG: LysR family transcriptional regulator [Pseudomonadales bacterium]CAE6894660.1 DNA-binding transcriptional regulator, LysR family [Pseudomonas oleovorans]HIQ41457.1 LysR family transcriptional regulator [Pseudomonas oleovorans]|tara:strand:+ start:13220 stop:14110 length:891 start_codon:yes stop_codon:yes gene_type:complete
MNHRRLTPSMSLLLAFEAAARHESYTRAARELSLTQSAVSRQVQALEAQLGVRLFRREGRNIVLTDVGRLYLRELGDALAQIRSATLQAVAYGSGMGTLRLALLPTFGSTWLLPRLNRFYAANPGVQVHVHSRIQAVDFADGEIDAAITVGSGDWPELVVHPLLEETMVVVASPALLAAGEVVDAETIAAQTLLQVASHPPLWASWFARHGLAPERMRSGPNFELTSHLLQAVRSGIGVGLVPQLLVADDVRHGHLLRVGEAIPSQRTYCLTYPPRNAVLPSLKAFRQWLLAELGR